MKKRPWYEWRSHDRGNVEDDETPDGGLLLWAIVFTLVVVGLSTCFRS